MADDIYSLATARSPLAEALRYSVKLNEQLPAYTEDGRPEIDDNPAENALRGICRGRKNLLFAGADCGGERAAAMYSLLEKAKLNSVNSERWLSDVLDRIGKGHPINHISNYCRGDGRYLADDQESRWSLVAVTQQGMRDQPKVKHIARDKNATNEEHGG